ncbi:basic-leucine zipper transcription factor [Phycomyces blakesleeanus]|uniref:Basic-leucine zipper transcription factor n=2 Tax=Phycomyces blakesleeanus TaxID=4837 RepID=A0A167LJQ8_PHYB8|nr:basic-leucine zipper transcription factor [Phycomyces blakesleeanus NRRL 1555(-)]OAD70608.1 basic-leucine zipper transcription factor [Phycomyces blakesleeanus NRRL 1555(-)]|eukprot:XP_018288648.1 basic-leucine zipper transcription factor [Phycomyces blakesleeanus NRRL 1555(-)]
MLDQTAANFASFTTTAITATLHAMPSTIPAIIPATIPVPIPVSTSTSTNVHMDTDFLLEERNRKNRAAVAKTRAKQKALARSLEEKLVGRKKENEELRRTLVGLKQEAEELEGLLRLSEILHLCEQSGSFSPLLEFDFENKSI